MLEQNRPDELEVQRQKDKREQRMMWMFSGAIIVLILGAMGANMMFHKESSSQNTDISSQSRTPEQ